MYPVSISYIASNLSSQPTNRPVIVAAPQFVGLGVINTDFYYADGGIGIDGLSREWYINTVSLSVAMTELVNEFDRRPISIVK